MKRIPTSMKVLGLLALIVAAFSFSSYRSNTDTMPDKVLRHVVLFKFKEGTDPARIEASERAFAALPAKIPEVRGFEWGMNNSPEGLDKGLTHCYLITFNSEEDRTTYLPHPDHQAFVKTLDGIIDDVVVVDYWTK